MIVIIVIVIVTGLVWSGLAWPGLARPDCNSVHKSLVEDCCRSSLYHQSLNVQWIITSIQMITVHWLRVRGDSLSVIAMWSNQSLLNSIQFQRKRQQTTLTLAWVRRQAGRWIFLELDATTWNNWLIYGMIWLGNDFHPFLIDFPDRIDLVLSYLIDIVCTLKRFL